MTNSFAEDVRTHAAEWLERRVDATWSNDDQSALETWIAQSPSHRIAYLRAEAAWRRTYRLAALRSPVREFATWRVARLGAVGGLLASIIVLAGIAANFAFSHSSEQTYTTGIGERKTIALADGSRIDLNTDTVLRTDIAATKRTVWLDKGEAYFEIVHSSHLFAVVAGDHRVTDLGTKFLVKRSQANFEVTLVEGLARFEQTNGDADIQSVLLKPGDVAVAADNTLVVTKKPAKILADALGWREGQLIFDHTALADVAQEFNRYNHKKLVIADQSIARREVLGTFQANNVTSFAQVAAIAFGYRVEDRGREIVISR